MRKIYAVVFVAICHLTMNCGKEIPGPEGPEGPQGITGKDGATILSGTSDVTADMGKIGDFYLYLPQAILYGPKTENGWGIATYLQGEQGMPGEDGKDGKDGADFLGGNGVPAVGLGKPGDFYFDKTNLAVFGPKTDNGWGGPVSLKAPEQRGVRTLLKYNTRFENLVNVTDYYIDTVGEAIPVNNIFKAEMTFEIADLADYLNNGLVFVYTKRQNLSWKEHGLWGDNWRWSETPVEDYAAFSFYINEPEFTETQIIWRGSVSEQNFQEYPFQDFNTPAGKQLLSDLFVFDIRIVLVPASSIEYLSRSQPNLRPENIARFLRLN